VAVSGRFVIGEGSRVEATVVADAVEVSGELRGDVKARSLVLAEKARVQGTVEARVLIVREGAWLSGSVSAGEPARPAPVETRPAPAPAPAPHADKPADKPAEKADKAGA
jgi:cytoskeletal protein CcmA (bactofilin family)